MAQELDYLAMSDEEWLRAAVPPPVVDASSVQDDEGVTPDSTETSEVAEAEATIDTDTEDAAEAAPSDEPSGESSGDAEDADEVETDNTAETAAETSPESDAAENKTEEEIDYKAAYEKLTRPFRANGKEIQVKNIDDAIALMQMGANYNKKMAALKPNLKLLKLLENNGLLSEEKLSFLIDLDKKNPDAISKLVKDSGLDPLEMDVSKSEYKPKTYTVDDRELELDAVLEKIQDTPTFQKTLDVVSNKWDGPSKQIVAATPQLIEVINSHMQSGVYDLISTEVERERMLGRLNGMSDIDAYRHVGEAMHNRGAFNTPAKSVAKPAERQPITPKPKADDAAVRAKKLAASTPKAAAPVKNDPDFNPLALSDEDFAKIGNPRLM